MRFLIIVNLVLAANITMAGSADVDVVCEQIGSPRFVGSKIVVGIAIQRGEEAEGSTSVDVWDDFPIEYKASSRGFVLNGNPGDSVEVGSSKTTKVIPENDGLTTFLYYPMGEVGGWLRTGGLPESPIQYRVYVRWTMDNTEMIREFEFEVGLPESRGGTEILEGFWSGDLCDGPTIGGCSVSRGSPLRVAFWDRNEFTHSEYAFDLAFPNAFSMDATSIVRTAKRWQSTDPEIRVGDLQDYLREQQVRREHCPKTSSQQRALLSFIELPAKVQAGGSTLDSFPLEELQSTSKYLRMAMVDAVTGARSDD